MSVPPSDMMASSSGGSGFGVGHPEATFWQQFTATFNRNILRKKRTMKHTLTVLHVADKKI